MRKKEWKLVVTFHTTADAIAFEKACKENDMDGRMIPVPRELSAGCGLAWCAPVSERAAIESFLGEQGISHEEIAELFY